MAVSFAICAAVFVLPVADTIADPIADPGPTHLRADPFGTWPPHQLGREQRQRSNDHRYDW